MRKDGFLSHNITPPQGSHDAHLQLQQHVVAASNLHNLNKLHLHGRRGLRELYQRKKDEELKKYENSSEIEEEKEGNTEDRKKRER